MNVVEADVPFAPFDLTDVAAVELSDVRKFLLAQTGSQP